MLAAFLIKLKANCKEFSAFWRLFSDLRMFWAYFIHARIGIGCLRLLVQMHADGQACMSKLACPNGQAKNYHLSAWSYLGHDNPSSRAMASSDDARPREAYVSLFSCASGHHESLQGVLGQGFQAQIYCTG